MLDPRIAFLNPSHPYKVSYRLAKDQTKLFFTIATRDGAAGRLVFVLESLLGLAHQLDRAERSAAREIRVDATIKAWEKRKDAVRLAYRKLRGLGVRHRAAVLAVSEQEAFLDLRTAYGWRRADFSACIGPSSLYYQPSVDPRAVSGRIRAVFVLTPKRAKRTNRGGLVKTGRAAS